MALERPRVSAGAQSGRSFRGETSLLQQRSRRYVFHRNTREQGTLRQAFTCRATPQPTGSGWIQIHTERLLLLLQRVWLLLVIRTLGRPRTDVQPSRAAGATEMSAEADAVVDGLAGIYTLVVPKRFLGPWRAWQFKLTKEQLAYFQTKTGWPVARIVGIALTSSPYYETVCCGKPMLVIEACESPAANGFQPKARGRIIACSVCGAGFNSYPNNKRVGRATNPITIGCE
jgi:hypothetical protein